MEHEWHMKDIYSAIIASGSRAVFLCYYTVWFNAKLSLTNNLGGVIPTHRKQVYLNQLYHCIG